MAFDTILANRSVLAQFQSEIKNGTHTHAYVIEGKSGSGRTECALQFVAALCCRGEGSLPCLKCDSCRKILSRSSADVHFITRRPDKQSIGVESVREISQSLYIKPNDIELRVYIIKPAEKLTDEAQNALLKMLEEPPEGSMFFLIVNDAKNLLETIRSRAKILKTEPLTNDEMTAFIRERFSLSDREIGNKLSSFGGCIGCAIEQLDKKGVAQKSGDAARQSAAWLLQNLQSSPLSLCEAIVYLTKRHKSREDYSALLEALSELCAQNIINQKQNTKNEGTACTLSSKTLYSFWETVRRHSELQYTNPPVSAAITALSIDLYKNL